MLRVRVDEAAGAELSGSLDVIVAEGACRMLAAALEAEVDACLSSFTGEFAEHGRRLAVRNGHAEARSLVTGAGPLELRVPRVDGRRVDKVTGERMRLWSCERHVGGSRMSAQSDEHGNSDGHVSVSVNHGEEASAHG